MTYQHKDLAAGGWSHLSFFEQMANIVEDAPYRVGEAFLGGMFYDIRLSADDSMELTRTGTPVSSSSVTRITLGDVEYLVTASGDGEYVFGRMEDAVTCTSTAGGTIDLE